MRSAGTYRVDHARLSPVRADCMGLRRHVSHMRVESPHHRRNIMLAWALASLLLGTALYLLFRPWTFEAASWFGLTDRPSWLADRLSVPDWVRFNLPDGLWLYAFLLSVTALWTGASGKLLPGARPWLAGAIVVALGHEFGQAVGVTSGTFDFADVIAYAVATIAAHLTWRRQARKQEERTPY